jgi:hypothetical protein
VSKNAIAQEILGAISYAFKVIRLTAHVMSDVVAESSSLHKQPQKKCRPRHNLP